MKKLFIVSIISLTTLFFSCDDKIDLGLPDSDPVIVVDAWLNNLPETQQIVLTWSQNYFDTNEPAGITDAQVIVTDGTETFEFVHSEQGKYTWTPPTGETFGTIGSEYTLTINIDEEEFTSVTEMNKVPTVDSVTFSFEPKDNFFPDSYLGEFWSRDIKGEGNTYWIKSYKNGELLSKPSEMNIAYDAGFSKGGELDNLIFIPPIRNAVNPFDEDQNGDFVSPFEDGDELYVEIHSISEDAFNFLTNVRIQTDRPGGFAELFAQPLSNVPTNIVSSNPNATKLAQGFFNVAAIESNSATLDISKVPKGN